MINEVRLSLDNLHKRYDDLAALDGLSLEVHSGEIVGLIGPDGAGKTTAMRIICSLILPDDGRAVVMGNDSAWHPTAVKEHIGYMPQRFSLYPDLTVAENLRFFSDLYLVPARDRIEREKRLMEFSRLGPFRSRRAGALSGGMKQKLALCCTLIHTPDVLILDEPTTGVDPVSRQEFWEILRSLAADGIALLVSTPYMDEAQLCDKVLLVHRGKVIAQGTPEEVTCMFPGRLLEVAAPDTAILNRALHALKSSGVEVNRFGGCLHVACKDEEQLGKIRDSLSGLDLEAKEIPPTIEDVFVALMGDDEREYKIPLSTLRG